MSQIREWVEQDELDIKLLEQDGQPAAVGAEAVAYLEDKVRLQSAQPAAVQNDPTQDLVRVLNPEQVGPAAPQAEEVQIVTWEEVLQAARKHARGHNLEVGGVCVGRVEQGQTTGRWTVEVTATIIGEHTVNQGASVAFTPDTWSQVNRVIDEHYEPHGERMVGWYHTHPHFGVFMSSYDRFVHENFFNVPWHIALVIDPHLPSGDDFGFFAWHYEGKKGEVRPCQRVEIRKGGYPRRPKPAARPLVEDHAPKEKPAPSGPGEPPAGGSTQAVKPEPAAKAADQPPPAAPVGSSSRKEVATMPAATVGGVGRPEEAGAAGRGQVSEQPAWGDPGGEKARSGGPTPAPSGTAAEPAAGRDAPRRWGRRVADQVVTKVKAVLGRRPSEKMRDR